MLPGPREAQRVHPNVILAVLSLAALAYAVLSPAVIPALPALQRSLHASETGVTWLLTGFLLSASVGTAIIGKLGDMYGKQRLLVWTLLTLAAGTLLAALSGALAVLIVARIVQGVAGGIFPLSGRPAGSNIPAARGHLGYGLAAMSVSVTATRQAKNIAAGAATYLTVRPIPVGGIFWEVCHEGCPDDGRTRRAGRPRLVLPPPTRARGWTDRRGGRRPTGARTGQGERCGSGRRGWPYG